ncbi:MAG: helix-turn-helix domain-containing protein [Opitutaceae bacterium]
MTSSQDTFHDLCRLRSTLEAFAATRLPGQALRAQTLGRLKAHLAALKTCARKGDYEAFHQADMALHQELVSSCEVPTLVESWRTAARALDVEILAIKKEHWPSLMALYREHELLFEAWSSNEVSVIEEATHHHLEVGWYRQALAAGRLPEAGEAVDRVASFLSAHYASAIDLEWVAANVAFMSSRHMARLFQERFGSSPYAWLRRHRLERAAQLLTTTDRDIAEVGRSVGYVNASHFARDFRRQTGLTPKAHRNIVRA